MAKKTSRKELLKSQDEFISFSYRALAFFSTRTRELKTAGIVIAAAALIFIGVSAYYRHVEKKGYEAYNTAYFAMIEHFRPGMEPDRLESVQELFENVLENHAGSKAADLALPQLAFLKFMEEDYDGAIRLYSRFETRASGKDDFMNLNSLAVAASFEAAGNLNRAIKTLEPVAADPQNRFRETALFTLARLYRLAGQESRAAELARDFIEEFRGSPFVPIAKTYL